MSKNHTSSVISLPSTNPSSLFGHTKPTNLLNDIFSTNYLGGNHTVKCIFHDDKNSSLSVNFDTGDFKCHACYEYGTDMTHIYIMNNILFIIFIQSYFYRYQFILMCSHS